MVSNVTSQLLVTRLSILSSKTIFRFPLHTAPQDHSYCEASYTPPIPNSYRIPAPGRLLRATPSLTLHPRVTIAARQVPSRRCLSCLMMSTHTKQSGALCAAARGESTRFRFCGGLQPGGTRRNPEKLGVGRACGSEDLRPFSVVLRQSQFPNEVNRRSPPASNLN
jgi:hypothetical protein